MDTIHLKTFEIKEETGENPWLKIINHAIGNQVEASFVEDSFKGRRLLFYIDLDSLGENFEFHTYLKEIKDRLGPRGFEDTVCAMVVASRSPEYTKPFLKKTLIAINQMGGAFIGHPSVELLPDLENFETWSKSLGQDRQSVAIQQIEKLVMRLICYQDLSKDRLKVLALHAGREDMSTSLKVWEMVKDQLDIRLGQVMAIKELHVDEGKIYDCYGCPYETCLYFAKDRKCFYGGTVVEDLFPALEEADVILWICPNYNDAISAKLMAVINRMTALYRHMSFNDKYITAIIVSGNSGSDAVAGQLINALVVNKGFRLWPYFSMSLIANHPDDLKDRPDIQNLVLHYVDMVHKNTYKNITKL